MTPLQANEVLTPSTLKFIRHKARQLARRPGCSKSDREDLEQELIAQLLRRLPKFNPERGNLQAFVKTVIERHAATLANHREADCRDPHRHESLHDMVPDEQGVPSELGDSLPEDTHSRRLGTARRDDFERSDLANDVTAMLERLPRDLRDLAERLKHQSLAQIAREMGVPRTTLSDARRRLRQFFQDAGLRDYLTAAK